MAERSWVHFIPLLTTLVAIAFAPTVLGRYRRKGGTHLLWWGMGIVLYGIGTYTESFTTLMGWNEGVFRAWYISGALLGGAPLAQGTVYLLLSRKVADRLAVALVSVIVVASVGVLLTPINYEPPSRHGDSASTPTPAIGLSATVSLQSARSFRGSGGWRPEWDTPRCST